MVISGKRVDAFIDANYARISRFRENGSWNAVSTNHSWELFWCELSDHKGDCVELSRWDGLHSIQTDENSEYIEIEQQHKGLFGRDEPYLTRFRPFLEKHTETKPWQGGHE